MGKKKIDTISRIPHQEATICPRYYYYAPINQKIEGQVVTPEEKELDIELLEIHA